MPLEQMEMEADRWFWYDIFVEEVREKFHHRAVLRYIAEEEIRQEDVLAVGGVLISCGQVNHVPRFIWLIEVELQMQFVLDLKELGKNYRVGNRGGDECGEYGGTRVANEVALCSDVAREEVDEEKTKTKIEHAPQTSGRGEYSGGGRTRGDTNADLDEDGRFNPNVFDLLQVVAILNARLKEKREQLIYVDDLLVCYKLKQNPSKDQEVVEKLFKEVKLKRGRIKGDEVCLIDGKMSAKTKWAADSSIPLENFDLSGYTTNSATAERETLLSGVFGKAGKKKRAATLPPVPIPLTKRVTRQTPLKM
ncbi:hypothetical protein GIB67_004868 [Kingdonia uniflora]|uniref:Uncharacterized protein n=1 Tax=Kingdonia uniflora TaxID=39325 RepID=A0A7J7LNE9_9MAGN|nr:hypothetical protein GIB67_004868 [Kingdonia uniflora]